MTERFESIFEFKIRLLRPRPEKGEEINWVLKSLGVDDIGIKIYNLLMNKEGLTTDEILSEIGEEEDKVLSALDMLYSIGVVEKLGSAYFVEHNLSDALRTKTLKILSKILNELSKIASRAINR